MKNFLLFVIIICFAIKTNAYTLQKYAVELNFPWGMTWLDSTKLLITEKKSTDIILLDTKKNTSIKIKHTIPVASLGQGGLLDILSEGNIVWITCSIMKNNFFTTYLRLSHIFRIQNILVPD